MLRLSIKHRDVSTGSMARQINSASGKFRLEAIEMSVGVTVRGGQVKSTDLVKVSRITVGHCDYSNFG
jgi:hypothetical protein